MESRKISVSISWRSRFLPIHLLEVEDTVLAEIHGHILAVLKLDGQEDLLLALGPLDARELTAKRNSISTHERNKTSWKLARLVHIFALLTDWETPPLFCLLSKNFNFNLFHS